MYKYITNPLTGRKVKITGRTGRKVFSQHLNQVGGGCALNKVAVDGIEKKWNYIYVPKNPGDPGSCIGAVLALNNKHIDFDEKIWYNKV